MMQRYLVIDFDSTLIRLEALDELAKIALSNRSNKTELVEEIEAITKAGMEGKITFAESLRRRLDLFSPSQEDIDELVSRLFENVTPSVVAAKDFIGIQSENIYVISGGFKEYIVPVASSLGIIPDHILANTFTTDREGNITGFDADNPLSRQGGKEECLRSLRLSAPVVMVGDGYTDYLVRESGEATVFIAFVENAYRNKVVLRADHVAKNFQEVIAEIIVEADDTPDKKELIEATDQI